MTINQATHIAKKYVKDEIAVLELVRDILAANTEGYKEAHKDMNDTLARIQAGEPGKDKK